MDRFKFRRQRIVIARISWLLVLAVLINYIHWDFSDLSVMPVPAPKAEAQAASQTTFYFKPGTSLVYWGVPSGVIAENSPEYADGVSGSPTSKTTALAMHPIAGPVNPTTTVTTVTGTETGTTDPTVLWYRTFLMPLASGTLFTSSTTFSVGVSGSETSNSANAYVSAYVYVYDSNTNASAKVLTTTTEHATELPLTTAASRIITVTNNVTNGAPAGNYTSDSYDYLAVELWVRFKNTSSTSYSASLLFGGNAVLSGTSANATPASYITIGGTTVDTFDPLWLKPTSSDRNPMPETHQSGDSFQAGTLDSRRAGTVPGTSAETNTQAVTVTGNPLYYRMNIWCSPPLLGGITIPAANWVVHFHGNETAATDNARPRVMIYTWKADDTGIRTTIKAVANMSVEFGTATTNNQIEDVVAGSAASITAGDRVCVDVELVSLAASTAGNVNFRFGSPTAPTTTTYDSAVLPPMNYASTPTPLQYQAQLYEQLHYKFDADNDGETHAGGWTDKNGPTIEDVAATYDINTNFRVRVQFRNTGGETDPVSPTIYARVKSPPGSWTLISNASTPVDIELSANFAQGTATTRQLTDITSSGWDFAAGQMIEDSGGAFSPTSMTAWTFTEWEWSLKGTTAETYQFKVTDNGADLNTYTVTPEVTIAAAVPLGVTAPANVTLTTGNPSQTKDTTFPEGSEVTVTDGGSGWSLTVIMQTTLTSGGNTIASSNVKIRKDGTVGGGGDTYTIWGGTYTNVTETNATESLDVSRTVGSRSSGTGGDLTSVRPSIQVTIPGIQPAGDYTGTMRFTVA